MSMKIKKTRALILSLVTVFSAAFTSMADVEVVEEVDQIVATDEVAIVSADLYNTAIVVDTDVSVETVEEITEDVNEDGPEESSLIPADLLGGSGKTYYFGPNKMSATVSEIFTFVGIETDSLERIEFRNSAPQKVIISGGDWTNITTSSELSIQEPIYDLQDVLPLYLYKMGKTDPESVAITFRFQVTVNDILPADFPNDAANGWPNEGGAKIYKGKYLYFHDGSSGGEVDLTDTVSPVPGTNDYSCSTSKEGTCTFHFDNSGKLLSIEIKDTTTTHGNGIYKPVTPWRQLQADISAAGDTPTTIKLTQDVIAEPTDAHLVIGEGQEITLDLDGHNIIKDSKESGGGNCIDIGDGATLTIKDESTATHNFKVVDGLWVLDDAGDKTLTGGCIMGINPKESDYDGIGVFINSNGTLNLRGGNIVGNKAGRWGGGVNVCGNAVFNIYGGSVIGNTAGDNGGGVCVDGELNVYGGSISENTLTDGTTTNNVYLKDGKYITIGDDCSTAKVGVTTEMAPTESVPVKITKNGTAADVDYFTSDSPDYIVAYNENGYLELQKPAQKTIADILPANFPTKAEDGWVNENGCRICKHKFGELDGLLVYILEAGKYIPGTFFEGSSVLTVSGNNYVYYEEANGRITFCMNGDVIESIKIEDVPTACPEIANGIYKFVAPIPTPTPVEKESEDHEPLFTGTWNNPVKNGSWSQDSHGIWHYASSETFKNTWAYIYNPYAHDGQNTSDWFWFDRQGNMLTGWQQIGGKWYYLHPDKDGVLGSCLIGPAVTPDGHTVDASGAWDGNGTEPVSAAAKAGTTPGASQAPYAGTWNAPVQNGVWSLDANGIWHYTTTQQFKNTWAYIYNPYAHDGQHTSDWFWFDEKGNMLTGWQRINGKWYYLHPNKDGVLGSCLIGPTTTPDGYKVDETGARVD